MSITARQSTARIVTVGPVLDATGVAVTDGVVADFKISKNGGAPAALNGSATLTHRHTGHYSLSLTATDLDTVGSAEITIDDTVNSCGVKCITVVEEVVYDAIFAASANAFTGAAGSSKITGVVLVDQLTVIATGGIAATSFAGSAITAASTSADFITEIAAGIWGADATTYQTQGTFGQAIGDPVADTNTIFKATVTDATGATVGVDVAAILVDTGTDIPASIAGIGTAGGAAINVDATTDNAAGGISGVTSATTKVGTETGTFANASSVDGSFHLITHAANTLDWVYQFLTGGGTSVVNATWTGYLSSNDDTLTFQAWNHVGAAWQTIGTQAGQNGTANVVKNLTLYARHRGTSAAELGKVYLRVQCTGTSPVLRTDQFYISYAVTSRTVGYANGQVWIDTVAGTAGTESFVNGVADFPVLTLADALTIATANKLTQFDIANGSTITMAGATTTKRFTGHEWILELGGQNISGTNFEGANKVTGVSSGTTEVQFEDCVFGDGGSNAATLPPGTYIRCGFNTNVSFAFIGASAGRYVFVDCYSNIAAGGASTPYFTFTGASTVMFRRYSGGAHITFDASTAALTYECLGGGNLTVALAGSDVEMRGIIRDVTLTGITSASTVRFVGVAGAITLGGADGAATIYGVVGTVTDNRTGGTLTNTANLNTDLDAILADTGTDGVVVAAGSKTGYTLTATTGLGNQTADITGTISTVTTLTNLPAITANWITAAGTASDFGAEIADAVWDEAIAGHLSAGSTGLALNSAGSAGDPWSTALPGAYGAGTAGEILGDWKNAGRLDLILDIIAADVVNIDGAAMRGTDSAALAATALSTTQWTNTLATNLGTTNTTVAAIGATGTGLSAIPWNAAWDAEVQSEVQDAITASALATAANLLLVDDIVSYCLTVLVGACADAGTSAETYVRALNGETFTVDFTGLDATGNRTTTTLSKV